MKYLRMGSIGAKEKSPGKSRTCWVCGFVYYEKDMVKQDGHWKCKDDYDKEKK